MESVRKRVLIFDSKHPFMGPAFWIATIHYFVAQIVAAGYWLTPFSYKENVISDLGNTVCGDFSGRYACSPLYTWMNISFVALGLLMVLGSLLIYCGFRRNTGSAIAFMLMGFAGIGTILVGVFPENTVAELHFVGALMALLLGDIAVLLFGFVLGLSGWFRVYTIATGVLTLAALILYFLQIYLGIGPGGMERLAAYPQTIWLIVFGTYLTRDRFNNIAAR